MTTKQTMEVVMMIIIFFLSVLLLFVVLNGKITLFMVIGALSSTYLFVHYWEKRYRRHMDQSEIKRNNDM